jgi:hypothetical protein
LRRWSCFVYICKCSWWSCMRILLHFTNESEIIYRGRAGSEQAGCLFIWLYSRSFLVFFFVAWKIQGMCPAFSEVLIWNICFFPPFSPSYQQNAPLMLYCSLLFVTVCIYGDIQCLVKLCLMSSIPPPPPCYQQNARLMLYRPLLVVTVCVYCDISLLTEKASEMHYHSLLFVTVTKSKECWRHDGITVCLCS